MELASEYFCQRLSTRRGKIGIRTSFLSSTSCEESSVVYHEFRFVTKRKFNLFKATQLLLLVEAFNAKVTALRRTDWQLFSERLFQPIGVFEFEWEPSIPPRQ